jgi:hypothetical protein
MGRPTNQRDYFAEMYVAGVLADAGWNVYFPRRDLGFDFIITKASASTVVIRPVQVKGKYPEPSKTQKRTYGFRGKLTAVHADMVLAIPFFTTVQTHSPLFTAYMPLSRVKRTTGGFRCEPATFDTQAKRRRDFMSYFDANGLAAMERPSWS